MRKLLLFLILLLFLNITRAQDAPNAGNDLVGINLSAVVDWTTEHPFIDVFKTARPWISQKVGAEWGQGGTLALTPEGWVAALEPDQYAETVLFSADPLTSTGLDGLYTLLFDGDGTITFRGDNVRIASEGPGFMVVEIKPSQGSVFLQITATNVRDPLRNIRLLLPGGEALYRNEPFSPLFLQHIARFKTLRFMDWMNTNNSTIKTWADRPQPTDATYALRGVPVELMVQLANTVHADPWFNMPHEATDEYIREFATYVRDNLDPDLKIYLEYSNETWNGQFAQAEYVQNRGMVSDLGAGDRFLGGLRFASQRAVHIFKIWSQVFNGRSRLVRVLASQAANPWTGEQMIAWRDASVYTDALAIAPYFSCDDPGNPETADAVAALTVDELLARQLANVQPDGCAAEYITQHMELTKKYELLPLAYEGGQHLLGYGGAENNDALTNLFIAANRNRQMGAVYLTYLNAWRDAGGGMFMLFSDITAPSKFGSWGLLEYVTQLPSGAPKYQAVMAFLDTLQSK